MITFVKYFAVGFATLSTALCILLLAVAVFRVISKNVRYLYDEYLSGSRLVVLYGGIVRKIADFVLKVAILVLVVLVMVAIGESISAFLGI